MSIVGVALVKDEADIIGWTISHLIAQGVDRIIVADNLSTDGTRAILDDLPVTVVDDTDPAHYQGQKVTRLVHQFCTEGDWVVPFDADEHWTGQEGTLAEILLAASADVVTARVWDYLPQPSDPDVADPYLRTCWREPIPEMLPVVAFRYHPDAVVHDGNHNVTRPGARAEGLRVRHLQYRSYEQFCRKLRNGRRALEATNLPVHTGWHWRTWGAMSDAELLEQWELLTLQHLVYDPL